MKTIFRHFILPIFLVPLNVFAFSCPEWKPNFTTMAAELPVVIYARVIDVRLPMKDGEKDDAIKVEVISAIKNSRPGEQFLVAGSGFFGGPNMGEFGMGSEWIFALDSLPPGGLKPILTIRSDPAALEMKKSDSNIREARINLCSTYWLKVENGIVKGDIEGRNENGQMSLNTLIAKLTPKTSAIEKYAVKYLGGNFSRDDSIPPPPDDESTRDALIFAKKRMFFAHQVFSECALKGTRALFEAARKAEFDWMDRNHPYEYAATYWLQAMSEEIERKEGEEASKQFMTQSRPNIREIFAWLKQTLPDLGGNKCEKWIERLQNAKNDLNNSKTYGDVLSQLYLYELASREQRANLQWRALSQKSLDSQNAKNN